MVAERIRECREALQLSQRALARLAGVSAPLVNQLESGAKPDMFASSLYKLATALRVEMRWLWTGEGPQTATSEGTASTPKARKGRRQA